MKNNVDVQYLRILQDVLDNGVEQENRTKYKAKFIPSATIIADLREGFPLLTSKKVYRRACFGEMMGFLKGFTSAAQFRELGCRIWDLNANKNSQWAESPFRKGVDDLGKIYGSTWRDREAFVSVVTVEERVYYQGIGYEFIGYNKDKIILSKHVDQLQDCVDTLINNPEDRRIILHAWFPELFPQMALPPCHVMYEFVPEVNNEILHMTMTQRSSDLLLGAPFNLAGSAFLLEAVAKATGYTAGVLTHNMTNVHLYENQYKTAYAQIDRASRIDIPELCQFLWNTFPGGSITLDAMKFLTELGQESYVVRGYKSLGPLPHVEMAV